MDWWRSMGRVPALDLANTTAHGLRRDVLDTAELFEEWRRLTGAPDVIEPRALRNLRSAVRDVLAAGNPLDRRAQPAVDELNRLAATAPAVPQLQDGELVFLALASPVDAYRAEVAASAIILIGGPKRSSVRRCVAPGCGRFLVAGNRQQRWCGQRCGTRVRVSAHRARSRRRTEAGTDDGSIV